MWGIKSHKIYFVYRLSKPFFNNNSRDLFSRNNETEDTNALFFLWNLGFISQFFTAYFISTQLYRIAYEFVNNPEAWWLWRYNTLNHVLTCYWCLTIYVAGNYFSTIRFLNKGNRFFETKNFSIIWTHETNNYSDENADWTPWFYK